MVYQYVILRKEKGIATITLNRPQRLNALSLPVLEELARSIEEVSTDREVRVLILTGAGRAFCAGGDFRDGEGSPASIVGRQELGKIAEAAQSRPRRSRGTSWALQNMDVPTIAMVNGPAVGAGFCIALACDLRIGSEDARFQVAWTRRGLTPAYGTSWFLPRLVGVSKALELIYTARMIGAEEALQLGLLNKLVSTHTLEKETMELARTVANGPPLALRLSKMNVYRGLNLDLGTSLELSAASENQLILSEDFAESARAFREKREPVFKGR